MMYEREIMVALTGNFYESDVSFRDQRKKIDLCPDSSPLGMKVEWEKNRASIFFICLSPEMLTKSGYC